MYEALIAHLRECAKLDKSNNTYGEAADAIEERCQQVDKFAAEAARLYAKQSRWIPVTERLPEEDGCYLVAVKNDHKRRYSKTAWFSHNSWFARQDVTYWMPLPQPPKEEGET